ncbi:hypothetical protein D3C71_1731470 [compost metagenome]
MRILLKSLKILSILLIRSERLTKNTGLLPLIFPGILIIGGKNRLPKYAGPEYIETVQHLLPPGTSIENIQE